MIDITHDALQKIQYAIAKNPNKLPKISWRKGGCAGNILFLELATRAPNDALIEISGISFLVHSEAKPFVENIMIYTAPGIGDAILIKNQSLAKKCKCGKSFSSTGNDFVSKACDD